MDFTQIANILGQCAQHSMPTLIGIAVGVITMIIFKALKK